jgi:hypothetical protein
VADSFEVRGGDNIPLRFEEGTTRGLILAAEYLLETANRTAPIEEGTLIRSGRTSLDGNSAAVSYDTPYAKRQHETLHYRHDPGRRAKWLEATMNEEAPAIGEIIAKELRGEL